MAEYLIIKRTPCPECGPRGFIVMICSECKGKGHLPDEMVPLVDVLHKVSMPSAIEDLRVYPLDSVTIDDD